MSQEQESQSEKNFVTPKNVPDYLVRQNGPPPEQKPADPPPPDPQPTKQEDEK